MVFHIPWIYTPVWTILAIWHQLTKTEKPELTRVLVMMRAQQSGGHHVRHAESWSRQPADVLNNRLLLDDDSTVKIKELFNTYDPIEIDASLSPEEKLPYMVEWWTKVH